MNLDDFVLKLLNLALFAVFVVHAEDKGLAMCLSMIYIELVFFKKC